MKRKESKYAIKCNPWSGPKFGGWQNDIFGEFIHDIYIGNNCNEENSCYIDNNDYGGYEFDPQYKSSLFVNTTEADKTNYFRVMDYEVYSIDYENRDYNNKLCKHPDIIWECIETKDISEESLKKIDDERELLNELDAIHCEDDNIRVKISKYCLKNPSKFLVGTQIVNEQYDDILRKWLGNDDKWKLIYRTSEHGYTANSFHEFCDNLKDPTLIVIKSSKGWIFGGYTTRSWKCDNERWGIYNEMI